MSFQQARSHYYNGELQLAATVAAAVVKDVSAPIEDRCQAANLLCLVHTHHRRDHNEAAKYGAMAVHLAKDLDPDLLATCRHNLAIAHTYAGHTERAAIVFKENLRASTVRHIGLARVHLGLIAACAHGDHAQAVAHYSAALAMPLQADVEWDTKRRQAVSLLYIGEVEQARRLIDECSATVPKESVAVRPRWLQFARARLAMAEGEFGLARQYVALAVQGRVDDTLLMAEVSMMACEIAQAAGDHSEANLRELARLAQDAARATKTPLTIMEAQRRCPVDTRTKEVR